MENIKVNYLSSTFIMVDLETFIVNVIILKCDIKKRNEIIRIVDIINIRNENLIRRRDSIPMNTTTD